MLEIPAAGVEHCCGRFGTVVTEHEAGLRSRRQRRRVVGRYLANAGESNDRLAQCLDGPQAQQLPSAQIAAHRIGVENGSSGTGRFAGAELRAYRRGNFLRDIVLQNEYVAEVAHVVVRPQVRIGARVDELHDDLQAIARLQHRSFDDPASAREFGDAPERIGGIAEMHRRRARQHRDALQSRQARDQQFGDAVGDVVVLIRRQVLEGQDDQLVGTLGTGGRGHQACCSDVRDLLQQSVATAWQRLEVAGLFGVVAECLADLPDAARQHVVGREAARPDDLLDLLAAAQLAAVPGEFQQHRHGFRFDAGLAVRRHDHALDRTDLEFA